MSPRGWTIAEWADRVAEVLDGARYVNLGVGLPSRLPQFLAGRPGLLFHCENGILGTGPEPPEGEVVPELIDASARPVTLQDGAALIPFDMSFSIIRGGHLDATVLGAFQVSSAGDLANWSSPHASVAGVGGAMDLAVGSHTVCVMMHHTNRDGTPKIVEKLDFPLTAPRCVDLIVTEFASIRVERGGLVVEDMADLSREELQSMTAAPLEFVEDLAEAVDG